MKGGEVIGEGASSYIIYPAPKCKQRRSTLKHVARVSKTKNINNLITKSYPELVALLHKIDPKQKYLYYPEPCTVTKLTDENKQDGVTKFVEIVKKGNDKWFDWRNPNKWVEPTKKELAHLRRAITLLHKNKIVHGDLHGDNIIRGADGLPRIIDFTEAVTDAPDDYVQQEEEFIERGWPTLEYYKVYQSDTPEGKEINDLRKKVRSSLLRTRKRRV